MHSRFVIRAATLLALFPAILPAQSVGKMLQTDLKNFGGDVWAVWTSPFRAGPKDLLTTGLVIGATAAMMPIDDDVDRWMVRNRNSGGWKPIEALREGGALYSGKYITPIAGGALIYGLATKNMKVQEGIFGCLASYTAGSVLRNYVLYYLVGRERPAPVRGVDTPPAQEGDQYEFTFPGESDWGMHSLPAGHAANIVACASFLNNRFEMGYVEPLLYAVAAGTGVGRLVDRRHWTSDTFIGMAFGYAIGRQVAGRSLKRAAEMDALGGAAAAALSGAYISPTRRGLTVGWQKTF